MASSGINKSKEIDFGSGKMSSIILRQALPLTASQLAALLYNIVDRIFIGHISDVGFDALTGIGLTFPIVIIINAFTLLFGQGGSPVFSIARGAGNTNKATKVLHSSFILLFCSSIILTLVGLIFMKPILYLFGADDVTYIFASDYLKIYLWGTMFYMISIGLNFYISAQGFPRIAMITTLAGSAINIALDPIFIFALGLGIKGAAIATLISQAFSAIWVLKFLTSNTPQIRLTRNNMRLDSGASHEIIGMGLTGFIMEITNSINQIVCNRTLSEYGGKTYIGIMTICNSVRSLLGVAITGIISGAQPVVGYNYGAQNYKRVKSGIVVTSLYAFSYTLVVWIMVVLFPGFFIGLFSDDAEITSLAVRYLNIYFMAYVFMSFQHSGQSTFMALGKAKQAIFFSIFRKLILVVPLTILLPRLMTDSVAGVFAAEPISNIVGGLASFLTMYFTLYRKLGNKDNSVVS